jgi:hypothetical protein
MSDYGYTLDATSARNAESIGKFIRDTGKYKGVFTRAELLISTEKGSRGIEFDFVSDGKECTLQLWTHSGTGEPYSALNMVNAIMTCLALRGIQPKKMVVEKYDYDSKQRHKVEVTAFPDLMNKPIGLLLQKELSIYNNKERSKMLIFAAFNAESEKTSTEILDKIAQPSALAKLVLLLADKDNRKSGQAIQSQQQSKTTNAYAALDDDLPF